MPLMSSQTLLRQKQNQSVTKCLIITQPTAFNLSPVPIHLIAIKTINACAKELILQNLCKQQSLPTIHTRRHQKASQITVTQISISHCVIVSSRNPNHSRACFHSQDLASYPNSKMDEPWVNQVLAPVKILPWRASFALLRVVEDYRSTSDFVKGGWPSLRLRTLCQGARAKQMSYCHAKGSPLYGV